MRTLILLLGIALVFSNTSAQETQVRFGALYSLQNQIPKRKLEFKIQRKPANNASLWLNQKEYRDRFTPNNHNKECVYNFYPAINGKKTLLLLVFRNNDTCATVTIANQNYLPLFRPCLDAKDITLQACD